MAFLSFLTALSLSLLAASSWACAGVTAPSLSGGEGLAGTVDAICPHDTGFFLSPDGRRLVFEVGDLTDPNYVAFGEPRFAVVDTESLERREVAVAPDVLERARNDEGPMAARACWSVDGRRLFFPGPGRGAWFALDVVAARPTLSTAERPDCAAEDAGRPSADLGFEIRQPSPRTIEIAAPGGGAALAEHRTRDAVATRLQLTHPVPSPDGRFLSYVLTEMQGSFATPSQAFVLDLARAPAARPRRLAAPVSGPPRWGPDDTLYTCAGGRGSAPKIVRWRPQALIDNP